MGKYTKSKTSRKTMKKQIKKSKSLNNKKTHKKTGGFDMLKKKQEPTLINQLYLKMNQLNIENYDIGLQTQDNDDGKKYFGNSFDLSEKTKKMMKDYILEEKEKEKGIEIDKELASKLLFRDSREQRLFKEYNITYYEPQESIDLDTLKKGFLNKMDASLKHEIDTDVGIYQQYIGKNLTYKFKTMRLPFIINKVFKVKDKKADKTLTMIEYQVPLKWALEKYLQINKHGVRQPDPQTKKDQDDYKVDLKKIFMCFDIQGVHRGEWFTGDQITKEECPKKSEIDDYLPLLAREGMKSNIWVTIKEEVNLALIGVKSKSNFSDEWANTIINIGTRPNELLIPPISKDYPSDKYPNINTDSVDFDARKIFNKKAEYYDGFISKDYNKGTTKLFDSGNFGFGLDGYVSPDKTLKVDFRKLIEKQKQIASVNEKNKIINKKAAAAQVAQVAKVAKAVADKEKA